MLINILLFLLGLATGLLACHLMHKRRLNLTIEGARKVNIGETATARIAPTPVGSVVSNVVYGVTPAGAFTIAPAADGLSAVYTAVTPGTGFVATVSATASDGSTLNDQAPLPDVAAPVATALNLSVSQP